MLPKLLLFNRAKQYCKVLWITCAIILQDTQRRFMTEPAAITSRILETALIPWRELNFLQQDNFKELSSESRQKLINSMLANNFAQPFYVWKDNADDQLYCLDGKHRWLILKELSEKGHDIPDGLPATFVFCENKQEAAKLVLVYSSMYAGITYEGMDAFLEMYQLPVVELAGMIDLNSINLDRYLGDIGKDFTGSNSELDFEGNKKDFYILHEQHYRIQRLRKRVGRAW